MAGVRDELILDVRQAQRAIDQLEQQVTRAFSGAKINISVEADTKAAREEIDALDGLIVAARVEAETTGISSEITRAVDQADSTISLDADTTAAERELDQFRREQTEKNSRTDLGLGDAIGAGVFLAGINRIIDGAAEAEQSVGGLEVVFGGAADEVDRFNTNAAQLAGLATTTARQLTAGLGGALKGLGFEIDEAADRTVELVQRGADLSAVYGGTSREVVEGFGAALRGEFDTVERWNIFLNQSKIDARALADGYVDAEGNVTSFGRAQAAINLILEQSGDAAGQFARELETASGQAAASAAERANAAADLGETLLPLYVQINDVAAVAAGAVGALPGPVQAAGIALLALGVAARPVRAGLEAIGDGLDLIRNRAIAADGGIRGLTGRLVSAGVQLGAVYLASNLVSDAFSHLEKADLSQLENALLDLTDSGRVGGEAAKIFGEDLDDLAGSIERIAAPSLASQTQHTIDNLANLGGLLGNDDAPLDQARQKIDDLDAALASLARQDPAAARGALDALLAELPAGADRLPELLDDYNGALAEVDTTSRIAGPAVEGLTGEIDEQAEALDRAKESLDKFMAGIEAALAPLDLIAAQDRRTQAFIDLTHAVEDRAQAVADARARLAELQAAPDRDDAAIAQAQRELQEAIEATSLTLDGNSEAAIRNRDTMDELVRNSARVIESAREQGATIEELELIRLNERETIRQNARELGFASDAVDFYIDRIDAIPVNATTTVTVETAAAEAELNRWLTDMQRQIDLNPFSIDVVQSEKFVIRGINAQQRRLGGDTLPGWVLRGEDGPELTWETRAGFTSTAAETRKLLNEISAVMVAADTLRSQVPAFGLRQANAGAAGRMHPEDIRLLSKSIAAQMRPNVTFAPTVNNPAAAMGEASLSREAQSFKTLVLGPD